MLSEFTPVKFGAQKALARLLIQGCWSWLDARTPVQGGLLCCVWKTRGWSDIDRNLKRIFEFSGINYQGYQAIRVPSIQVYVPVFWKDTKLYPHNCSWLCSNHPRPQRSTSLNLTLLWFQPSKLWKYRLLLTTWTDEVRAWSLEFTTQAGLSLLVTGSWLITALSGN